METKQERSLEMRGVVAVVAVILVLMGVSASLATKDEPAAVSTEPPSAESNYQDPSPARLSVAADAEPGGDVEMYY